MKYRIFERDKVREEIHVWKTVDSQRDAWLIATNLADMYAETGRVFYYDVENAIATAIVAAYEAHVTGCACFSCDYWRKRYADVLPPARTSGVFSV